MKAVKLVVLPTAFTNVTRTAYPSNPGAAANETVVLLTEPEYVKDTFATLSIGTHVWPAFVVISQKKDVTLGTATAAALNTAMPFTRSVWKVGCETTSGGHIVALQTTVNEEKLEKAKAVQQFFCNNPNQKKKRQQEDTHAP
jgi:hypothetical protein